MGNGPSAAVCSGGAGIGINDAMIPVIAQPPVATAASLINVACRKYLEAAERLKRIEADWQKLPTEEAVTLISGIQAILRETRQFLEQGACQMSAMTGLESDGTADKNGRHQIVECRQKARDLANRVNEMLASSDHLIWSCLARQEVYERYQTAKALSIVIAGTLLTLGVALYLLLR